ncbi:hypothetical protein Bca4012_060172 [Brassica carinata]
MEPVTVKQLRGVFGDKFRDREWEYRCDKPRTDRWKEALASISCKTGLTFDKKSNESTFVRIIVKEVEKMIQPQGKFAVTPFSGGGQCMKRQMVQMDISRDSNSVLRAQLVALREKLHSLNSIIEMSEGVKADVFLMNSLQVSLSSQPTLASADIFKN